MLVSMATMSCDWPNKWTLTISVNLTRFPCDRLSTAERSAPLSAATITPDSPDAFTTLVPFSSHLPLSASRLSALDSRLSGTSARHRHPLRRLPGVSRRYPTALIFTTRPEFLIETDFTHALERPVQFNWLFLGYSLSLWKTNKTRK